MSDDEIEGEINEGEEDEEGGESEKEEEEVKEAPKFPPYVPKIDPLTQVLNINRNLDMLNSEVNVISSEFMVMSSAQGNRPKFYNISPTRNYATSNYNTTGGSYTSPSRVNSGGAAYWNNPNHITLSPSRYNPIPSYNPVGAYPSTNMYKTSTYASSPVRNAYSPSRNPVPSYIPVPRVPPPAPVPNMGNDVNLGRLINDIDNVLNNPMQPAPPMMPREETYNTFERAYPPSFRPTQEVITHMEPQRTIITETKPPLYGRSPREFRNENIAGVGDLYNRKPPMERYNIVQSVHKDTRSRSPLRNINRDKSPHFSRPRSAIRPPPPPATDFEIHDAVKTLFR